MDKINTKSKDYKDVLGGLPDLTNRDKDTQDVLADVVDKVNSVIDLGNLVEGFTFDYISSSGRTSAKLKITHTSSGKYFQINAAN
tara:strand:+ start:10170 stop:10424 length:255 start_codon:yes stop_codon:yes gene_type:complete